MSIKLAAWLKIKVRRLGANHEIRVRKTIRDSLNAVTFMMSDNTVLK